MMNDYIRSKHVEQTKNCGIKIDYRNCASRCLLTHCSMMHRTYNVKLNEYFFIQWILGLIVNVKVMFTLLLIILIPKLTYIITIQSMWQKSCTAANDYIDNIRPLYVENSAPVLHVFSYKAAIFYVNPSPFFWVVYKKIIHCFRIYIVWKWHMYLFIK